MHLAASRNSVTESNNNIEINKKVTRSNVTVSRADMSRGNMITWHLHICW